MACLVDTNILVRLAVPADRHHLRALRAVESLADEGLFVASQNFIEFWNVATRPLENNGLGRTVIEADRALRSFEQAFLCLPEPTDLYGRWRDLVLRFGVSGVKVHDARLVVIMLASDIDQILTFNADDFRRYEPTGIRAVSPEEI